MTEEPDTRKLIRELRKQLKANGFECVVVRRVGNDGHEGLVIRDPKTDQSVTVIIAHRSMGKGEVQNRILRFLKEAGARFATAAAVHEILERIFRWWE